MFLLRVSITLGLLALGSGRPFGRPIGVWEPQADDGVGVVVDGINFSKLNQAGQNLVMKADDEVLQGELDLQSGKQQLEKANDKGTKTYLSRSAFKSGKLLFDTVQKTAPLVIDKRGEVSQDYFSKGGESAAILNFLSLTSGQFKKSTRTKTESLVGKLGANVVTLTRPRKGLVGGPPPTIEIKTPSQGNANLKRRSFVFNTDYAKPFKSYLKGKSFSLG